MTTSPPPSAAADPERCLVHLVHADTSEARCVLPKEHTEQDTDHVDEHGHTAPVLVREASIAEVVRVARVARARQDRTAGA